MLGEGTSSGFVLRVPHPDSVGSFLGRRLAMLGELRSHWQSRDARNRLHSNAVIQRCAMCQDRLVATGL
jgi:hypothetical protein